MATWHVYRGINHTAREIYYGVSIAPVARVDGKHCRGATKTIRHWNCDRHDIEWSILTEFNTQPDASTHGHALERKRCPIGCAGYYIHQTAGI